MSRPYFRSMLGKVGRPGAANHRAGLDVVRRVAAVEQGAAHRGAPSTYCAALYLANSGAPTHNSSGAWQPIATGGGTDTWTVDYDYRPNGISAQCDATTDFGSINIRRAGLYLVTASMGFASIADTKRYGVGIGLNGVISHRTLHTNGAAQAVADTITVPMKLAATDYLQVFAFQDDSASEAYLLTDGLCRIAVTLIGPPA